MLLRFPTNLILIPVQLTYLESRFNKVVLKCHCKIRQNGLPLRAAMMFII